MSVEAHKKMKPMQQAKKNKNIIISGGGTGGHVFPAISIANALIKADKDFNILFVGASGKIEMEKVPAAGYKFIGLPVAGFQRKLTLKNISFFVRLFRSLLISRKIIKEFSPAVAVGVGGYASGPILRIANMKGIPTILQEQNSYAGVTNRLLSKKAKVICVAYENMEKYFPKDKIVITGNPIREKLFQEIDIESNQNDAKKFFGLNPAKKLVLVIGGSLGARTINRAVFDKINMFSSQDIQLLWQTGKLYYNQYKSLVKDNFNQSIVVKDFIDRMDLAYSAADIIVSRAGAGTISELYHVGKPVILIPSPNVAEDHQTSNAMALVNKGAAVMIKDKRAEEKLVPAILNLVDDKNKMESLSLNIRKMAIHDSANKIVKEILKHV